MLSHCSQQPSIRSSHHHGPFLLFSLGFLTFHTCSSLSTTISTLSPAILPLGPFLLFGSASAASRTHYCQQPSVPFFPSSILFSPAANNYLYFSLLPLTTIKPSSCHQWPSILFPHTTNDCQCSLLSCCQWLSILLPVMLISSLWNCLQQQVVLGFHKKYNHSLYWNCSVLTVLLHFIVVNKLYIAKCAETPNSLLPTP